MDTLYFDVTHAVRVHDRIIDLSGGLHGICDIGRLESVLEHIQSDDYYPTFESKLAHLVFCLVKFHSFLDGNKRSSIALGAYFLELNGYDWVVLQFIRQMENIVVWVAEGRIPKEMLLRLLEHIVCGDDYPEDLKLELIDSLESRD